MKRFLLFSGVNYYPSGGMSDFDDSFDTLYAAQQKVQLAVESWHKFSVDGWNIDWAEIVDQQTNNRWHLVTNLNVKDIVWKEGSY